MMAIAAAIPLRGIADVRPEMRRLVAIEDRTAHVRHGGKSIPAGRAQGEGAGAAHRSINPTRTAQGPGTTGGTDRRASRASATRRSSRGVPPSPRRELEPEVRGSAQVQHDRAAESRPGGTCIAGCVREAQTGRPELTSLGLANASFSGMTAPSCHLSHRCVQSHSPSSKLGGSACRTRPVRGKGCSHLSSVTTSARPDETSGPYSRTRATTDERCRHGVRTRSLPFHRTPPLTAQSRDAAETGEEPAPRRNLRSRGCASAHRALHPKPPACDALTLADTQLVVARGYGFESWAAMRRKIDSLTKTPIEQFRSALRAGDAEGVRALLEAHAEVREPSTRRSARSADAR